MLPASGVGSNSSPKWKIMFVNERRTMVSPSGMMASPRLNPKGAFFSAATVQFAPLLVDTRTGKVKIAVLGVGPLAFSVERHRHC
jgi:hypothetical protein